MATEATAESNISIKKRKLNDNDEMSPTIPDWSGKVFDGEALLVRGISVFLTLLDCARAAPTCKAFAHLGDKLASMGTQQLHRWFAAHPHLSRTLTLRPPVYEDEGYDADDKYYVGDMVYLGVYLQNIYPMKDLEQIVRSQPEFPWYDDDAEDKMQRLPRGSMDTDLAKLLRGRDAEMFRLWVRAAGLPNPRVQAALERFEELQTTETGGFGSYRIFIDGQGDTRLSHVTLAGEPHHDPSYGAVNLYDEEEDDNPCPISPFLLFACSRSQLLKNVKGYKGEEEAAEENLKEEAAANNGTGLFIALPDCDSSPTLSNDGKTAVLSCFPPLALLDVDMKPGTGIYSVIMRFDKIETAAAAVGVLCVPTDPKAKRLPRPHEELTDDMVGSYGELPGASFLHEITAWSQYGGLTGTTVKRLATVSVSLKDRFPVRGFGTHHNPDGPVDELGMVYDSTDGNLMFVADGVISPVILPIQGVSKIQFCAMGGGRDKVSILRFARVHLWQ
eukprot:CAMPEP_0194033334 /NCGR_PEP_ID=MMETSP0009_2-20130614/6075_1 /TAXON_ID=210454 /ORGANISM="Grammatophora oceanica, Strain CCMP 410" /LENGTH=501 /DNA_ID=CAMNT_0038674019 /DNA_START=122 /DNA_END=1627 /DNA_ORIENTATION=-